MTYSSISLEMDQSIGLHLSERDKNKDSVCVFENIPISQFGNGPEYRVASN